MDKNFNQIWNLISLFGIFIIFIDLFSLLFLSSTSPNFFHFSINNSYQSYLIKYQMIFIPSAMFLYFKSNKENILPTSTIIWLFCFINALLSKASSLMNAGNIYDIPLVIFCFIIFSISIVLMIRRKIWIKKIS